MKPTLIYMFAASALAACSPTPSTDARKSAESQKSADVPAAVPTANPVVWTIAPVPGPLITGKTATVRIDAKLDAGWHIYAITQPAPGPTGGPIATRISLPDGQPFTLAGDPKPTVQPEIKFDEAFRTNVQVHENTVGFAVPIKLSAATPIPDSVHVNVRYQVCNAALCYPPQTARLAAAVLKNGE
jgi:hypothetical protein